jgi:FemAB-related protein (PEP-CTERM system-associated)
MTRAEALSLAPPVTVAPCDDPAVWDRYVAGHPSATRYHSWAWRAVFAQAFGHASTYFGAFRGADLVGVLPVVWFANPLFGTFGVSLPFVNYGGVLADDLEVAECLLAASATENSTRGGRHVELRHTARQFPNLPVRSHKVSMHLALCDTVDAQFAAVDRKLRNQIRKADKSGLLVERGGLELVDAFYDVFSENMRDLGTPVYTKRFFVEVLRAFPMEARVFCVRLDGRPVAASVVVAHRGTVEVPWASSLREFNHLCVNVRLYWEMLQDGIDRQARVFDFGRSTPDEGTFHFKRQWGAEAVALHWEYVLREGDALPDLSPKNPKFRLLIDVWKRLPLPISRVLGPHVVRHIP